MQQFIFFIILAFMSLNVKAVENGEEETASNDSMAADLPNNITVFDVFANEVRQAAKKHEAAIIYNLYSEFFELPISQEEWESIAHSSSIEKWPHQNELKSAVAANLFLNVALDTPHQNLLRNGLRPLLLWTDGSTSFEEAFEQAVSNINTIFSTHPYMRRRTALHALANAARFLDPFAGFFLNEALCCLYDEHKKGFTEYSHIDEEEVTFRRRMMKFFNKNYAKVQKALEKEPQRVRNYINQPGIEDFVDLSGEELQDPAKLEAKAALGLPHYYKLLGDFHKNPERYTRLYDKSAIALAIKYHTLAGEHGDFEGYKNASYIIRGELNSGIYSKDSQEKKGIKYAMVENYEFLVGWYGFNTRYAHIVRQMDEHNIPRTPKQILEFFRSVLKERP